MAASIEVHHVSKKFTRGRKAHLNYGLRNLMAELLGRAPRLELRPDEFWAVEDVSFALEPGASFALIGRNGSGKTTLLKMLHGLLKPDTGRIALRGRVQALINLQAGFNGNLSGRDNILTSASLLGLGRAETRSVLEEIAAFAELDGFIGSPVDTYSSGMKARLGFSVAVHLKPEILLIDEVLAVGDHAFRNKCFTKMEALKKQGVTLVFVSHAHQQVIKLCRDALWMHHGQIRHAGPSRETVQHYLSFLEGEEKKTVATRKDPLVSRVGEKAPPKGVQNGINSLYGAIYDSDELVDQIECRLLVDGKETDTVPVHGALTIQVRFRLKAEVRHLCSTLNFHRNDGFLVAAIATMTNGRLQHLHHGEVFYEVHIPDFHLAPGAYVIMMPIADGQQYLWRNVVARFYVEGGGALYFGVTDLAHTYTVRSV